MAINENPDAMSFWEHLDVLRGILFRIAALTLGFAVIAFACREWLFDIILAPKYDNFIIYDLFRSVGKIFNPNGDSGHFDVQLINTGLAKQFVIHMKASIYAGFLVAAPYTLYQIFRFVSPALYANERRYAVKVLGGGSVMFALGVLLSYFLIFPLTFRFLGTYQVSDDVVNMISLESYMDTMMMLCVMMGIVFEIPILCWLFAKFGFITADFMKKYRKHAVVILLFISAIITPTADVFTLTVVAMPMWLLYEASIIIVQRTKATQRSEEDEDNDSETRNDDATDSSEDDIEESDIPVASDLEESNDTNEEPSETASAKKSSSPRPNRNSSTHKRSYKKKRKK
ncbi:MAG: twin-arginine translocase subunit TatC [Phocaeicola sp.]|nr:twin-arginine translocase subunit TatC [Phocaeicola sp.]MBR1596256.1 twin-arginine translocase subunit TatC [Phocaeicola sp.]